MKTFGQCCNLTFVYKFPSLLQATLVVGAICAGTTFSEVLAQDGHWNITNGNVGSFAGWARASGV